ncbi:SMP-30/gluconolactonase/LRE family protein [Horticoccus sp. 23ND18S-11]|uniref:SMP-30/gluconolactonase/LRE family protein n=1 Tax=Horticoccus sp. 23ND18S-11 TaxID=3391832 RepID=UPI0039C91855
MQTPLLPSLVLAIASTAALHAQAFHLDVPAEFARCVPAGATVKKVAGDMGFIEGPVWIASDGHLVFSDIPGNELKRWSAKEGVTTFRKPSANANGNTLDAAGRLLTCEHTGRRVAVQEKDGTVRTIVDAFEGRKLNSPNDVVVHSDGSIWFTDPEYGLKTNPTTKQREGKEQPGNYVYRHDPKSGRTTAVVKDFVQPNGLAFSPDEKKLYIADSGAPRHIRIFDVAADGTLSGGRVFCTIDQGGPDGIRVDRDGRVWSSAGDGVHIFAADGRRLGKILTPEGPANLCFGGADGRTLFMTARKSLYSIQVSVTGAAR